MASEPRIVVQYENGRRFRVTCDGYTVTTGKGDDGDASRDGMTPSQLFVASLGACIALYVSGYCKHHDIPCDALTVAVDHDSERAPSRTTAVSVRIHLGVEVSDKDAGAILQVARKCHVHYSIEHGMHIDIGFGSPAPAVEAPDA